MDRRIVGDVVKRTGRIIKSRSEVGGWPDLRGDAAPRDTDADGMPDPWEQQHGLNPRDASDGPQDRNTDGYTNIEEYLNGLTAPRLREGGLTTNAVQ